MKGWITLHRKLLKNPICQKPSYLSVWIHLLLMANYEETSFIWNNKKQILRKGQLLTGLKVLSKETGIAQTTVYRILNYLENEKQIKQEKTTKYTVITILNWDKYQDKNQEMENRWKTNGKQTETYNNVYNNINKQEEKISSKEKERKEREYLRTQELLRRSK
jgi:DNA-binding transcriptional regulator YhcF (GntR family)